MLAALSTIASLVIVLILGFVAVFLISVVVLITLGLLAGSTARRSEAEPVLARSHRKHEPVRPSGGSREFSSP
ncbi:hypothetical protein AB0F17_01620 [Nonomuraea sp. NPDC026600]|uniref:hypothetical protein n=1 Tax=Nonomuraea sp. NPDC026600 TaxID=3155363 RepID=UPI0033F593BD